MSLRVFLFLCVDKFCYYTIDVRIHSQVQSMFSGLSLGFRVMLGLELGFG